MPWCACPHRVWRFVREAGARGGALRAHLRACEAGRALRPWHRRSRRPSA